MMVLLAGLWYVQVVSASRYRADLQEQSLRIVRVPAIRGKILDRNGIALAENRPSYNVNVVPRGISAPVPLRIHQPRPARISRHPSRVRADRQNR